jgi:replication fork protection complex subunit Tof1/Swi1
MNLVKGDLLEILAQWQETDTAMKSKHRIALASVELLAPLTWPFEKNNEQMTINHHRHIPVLQHAQLGYKAAFLHHRSKKILKDIIRVALPSMAMPTMERSDRDDAIIKLSLYVLRNIAVIEHPNPGEMETGEEIGRSATIEAFSEQNVLDFILTVASGIGEDFRMQDGVLMEIIYHIIKAIDVETVFMSDKENAKKKGKDLTLLLRMEDDMKRAKTEPTRHNRFGTTLWLERNDGTRSFVSGQSALLGKATGLEKLDNIKKWKKPGGADSKGVSHKTEFDIKVQLNEKARHILRKFIEDFIDSGFNPLFYSIRRAIDSDVDRLLNTNTKQYFYAVAWFLEAERVRRKAAAKELKQGNASVGPSDDSFSVVAAVLNQEFLITLNRKMVDWFELKQWNELQAGMRCFTQILYTIQDMGLSLSDDDQEISENIQNRLFYEETTLNLIYDICRSFTKQPFRFVNHSLPLNPTLC